MQVAWLFWNMLGVHPYIHKHNASIYPWPLDKVFKDYTNHVECHHVSGFCLGSVPFSGYVHDVLLQAHGKVYEMGLVERLTAGETVLTYAVDVVLFLLIVAFVAPVAFATMYFFAGKRGAEEEGLKKRDHRPSSPPVAGAEGKAN